MKRVFILHAQDQTITSHSSPTELAQDGCWPWKSAEMWNFCSNWRCQQCLVVCMPGLGTWKWVAPSSPCIFVFPFRITLGPWLSGYRKEECFESLEDQQVAGKTTLLYEAVVMCFWLSIVCGIFIMKTETERLWIININTWNTACGYRNVYPIRMKRFFNRKRKNQWLKGCMKIIKWVNPL